MAGPCLRLGSGGQRELVTLTGDEIDSQVNLFAVSPLAAKLGERLIGTRNPVVPEAAGEFPGCVGTVNKGHQVAATAAVFSKLRLVRVVVVMWSLPIIGCCPPSF